MAPQAGCEIAANLPTWIGVWERIDVGVFLLWIAVLAVRLQTVDPVLDGADCDLTRA